MLAPLTRELLLYSLQIALLVGAGALAMQATDLKYPQARLACWRLLLTVCLLLPLWPAHVVDVAIPAATQPTFYGNAGSAAESFGAAALPHAKLTIWMLINQLPVVAVAGLVARAAWLAAGLVSLVRLTASAGDPIDAAPLRDLHDRIAPQAILRWHAGIGQPVAFGVGRPMVLLPEVLREQPIDVQSAVLAHELLHVARTDWLAGIVEQAVLCAFWFHPAVWWAVDQMELHREQVVDDLSIAAVGSRKTYLRALLEFADRPAPHAALAFGHRQLARRIQHLSQEIAMTRSRFVLSTVGLTLMMSASVFAVASALPLRTSTEYHVVAARAFDVRTDVPSLAIAEPAVQQMQVDAAPAPSPSLLERRRRAAEADRQAQDPQLQELAEMMKQAHSADLARNLADNADVHARLQQLMTHLQAVEQSLGAADANPLLASRASYPQQALKYGVGATVTMTATVTSTGQVVDIKPFSWSLTIDRDITDVGYWATAPQQAFIDACSNALRQWTPTPFADETTARLTFTFRPAPSIIVTVERRAKDGTLIYPAATSFSPARSGFNVARVGGDIRTPRKVQNVDPVYPPTALAAGVQGVVILDVTIADDGTVSDAHILRSVPLLDQAALDAVRQWTYEPTLKDGVAIPVRMTVTVNFSLRK